jgi:antibiotic biosynthesis monooxygenase (ABM) superfamily enzyme
MNIELLSYQHKGVIMIKVIVGYKVKDITQMQPIILKMRSQAMTYRGFVGSEILLSESDVDLLAVEKTWDRIEDWKEWENSSMRQSLLREAQKLLLEEPRVTIYRIMHTAFTWTN